MKKFLFDLDGTITKFETLPIIAKAFNIDSEIATLTQKTIAGQISFIDSFQRRVDLLKNIPVEKIAALLENIPLHEKIVEFIRNNSNQCAIVTGNLDVWIDALCRRIGCQYFSSTAEIDEVVNIKSILHKDLIVKQFQNMNDVVIYVGDGDNDFDAMSVADISIANAIIHPVPTRIEDIADYIIADEDELSELLNIIRK